MNCYVFLLGVDNDHTGQMLQKQAGPVSIRRGCLRLAVSVILSDSLCCMSNSLCCTAKGVQSIFAEDV